MKSGCDGCQFASALVNCLQRTAEASGAELKVDLSARHDESNDSQQTSLAGRWSPKPINRFMTWWNLDFDEGFSFRRIIGNNSASDKGFEQGHSVLCVGVRIGRRADGVSPAVEMSV